ncbi:AHH domain-containing protein [Bradyrhizobium sp. CCBAU 51745]|uniref:AHH domain-containing protein n=1 Tax=Bradyrhizobium sp. CCBAU 51745 TaxID=1325099 RepID=UPI002306D8B3|nr:AHH domain-containing protein [Bradyrhizobium sp. CCBAU 51745]
MAILWEHHIIPKKFKCHPAFRGLDEQVLGVEAPSNLIYLPADYGLARKMGVSPHPGGHDFRYYEAVGDILDGIKEIEDPNLRAEKIRHLMDAMRVGLVNGDLYTNAPLGGTGEEVARGVKAVIAGYARYREENLNQVDALGKFEQRSAEAGNHHLGKWSAILGNVAREKLLSEAIRDNPRLNLTSENKDLAGTPWQQKFVAADDSFGVPGSQAINPNHVPQLPGFIPSPLPELAPEGFTRIDPRLTDGLSGFPAASPDWQRFGQLPPSTAAPSDPLVLKFDPMTGAPLPYDENPLMRDPDSKSSVAQDALPWLFGGAALGVAAPFVLSTLPAWVWGLGALGAAGASAGASANAKPSNNSSGGVSSTGAPPYNPFSTDAASHVNGKGGGVLGSQSSAPSLTNNTADQEVARPGAFNDRFGSWPGIPAVAASSQPSGDPQAPAAGVAGAAASDELRRLTRVNASNAGSAFESRSAPVPYLPSPEFDDRFGNWQLEGKRPQQVSSPVNTFADEPSYAIPPPIWGLDTPANLRNDSEEWFSRWIQPLLRQD